MIDVLVVEDSPVARQFLVHILNSDPDIHVSGTARNGAEAVEIVREKRPDVVVMDINMPEMDGFQATRRIMETVPVPIVIVSATLGKEDVEKTFRAMEAGALAAMEKPVGTNHPDHGRQARLFIEKVKLMSEVKVVRRWPKPSKLGGAAVAPSESYPPRTANDVKVIALGASTGGPQVIQFILTGLPKDYPIPILIVQHMTAGFMDGFIEWLSNSSNLSVTAAVHGRRPLPGHVYIAPDGFHMAIDVHGRITLSTDGPENGLRPSISYLFRSVAEALGEKSVGILLTGMGRDGAVELKLMRDRGAITIAQDKESSVIHGMPGEAIQLHGAARVLSPAGIVALLRELGRGQVKTDKRT